MNLICTQYNKIVDVAQIRSVFVMQRHSGAACESTHYLMTELNSRELVCVGAFSDDAARAMLDEIQDWVSGDEEDSVFTVTEMAACMDIQLVS